MINLQSKCIFCLVNIIVLFLITSVVVYADTINPEDYEYSDDGSYIYEYNKKTKEKKKILDGWGLQMSHKKDRFLYGFDRYNPDFKTSSKAQGFYIYEIATKKDRLMYPDDGDYGPTYNYGWSPDDKYFILYQATYVEGGTALLNSMTGEIAASFGTWENSFTWINPNEIILTDLQKVKGRKTYIGASAHGIAIITIKPNKKKILKQATSTDDYWLIKYEPNKILFSSTSIAPGGIWGEAKETKTYWLMDNNGNVLKEVKDYKP